ncbi:MAG: hypothetical protein QME78_04715 [Thermodesulfobacteriota bacterium]|nr:hypothetical protein [Thermodesulfobacteriota bacterium]
METYILRIYRRGKGIPHRIIGIIEESGVEEKKAVTCLDELWRILNPTQAKKAPSEQKKESQGHKKRKPLRKAKVSMQERPGARR